MLIALHRSDDFPTDDSIYIDWNGGEHNIPNFLWRSTHPDTDSQMKMILTSVPDDLLDGLPPEDQVAIQAVVGYAVNLVEGDDRVYPNLENDHPLFGLAEIEWKADDGSSHTIWVEPSRLAPL